MNPFIFKGAVITVQPGIQNEIFHAALTIEHAF